MVIERAGALQKALIKGTIGSRLRQRPQAAELMERGVLRAGPATSVTVLERALILQKELVKRAINTHLRDRPEPTRLLERGVLQQMPGTSAWLIQIARQELHRELATFAARHKQMQRLYDQLDQYPFVE